MEPGADPVVYTGAGGPVPNGAFLFEGGAVDTNDLLWSKQKQAEQRVLESYAKREERMVLESFRKQQEQLEAIDTKLPSPIAHIMPPKSSKAPQKKLISTLISVKPAKHTLSPSSETDNGNKRARNLNEEGEQVAASASQSISKDNSAGKSQDNAKSTPIPTTAAKDNVQQEGSSAFASLADYSDGEDDA